MLDFVTAKILARLSTENLIASGLLLATALGSALYVYFRTIEKRSFREFFEFLIPHEIITHPSAKADFLFWITKRAITPFLMFPAGAVFVGAMGYATHQVLGGLSGITEPLLGQPGPLTIVIFTITMLLAYDISYYTYHWAQHKFPFLWELHKVHHSAEVMVGITKDRVHPLDELMNRAWDGVIAGFFFGLWTLISLNPVEATIFGVNVYVIRNILMMDFVRHTHLKISFGALNSIVLCPHYHQLHHSADPKHYDKNFGLLFSFWDRWFGTLAVPEKDESFTFGLMERESREYQSLFGLWVLPVIKMGGHIQRWLRLDRGRKAAEPAKEPSA
ncbi:MAG: sterol desaturase family protein [Beijerinckiaceae bacterium]|jgi:sterol desaturase/sphingolipid hydroxylase (fatty acid hydroxylase superfamily)|nr:sterol desaturase family protein [Beijerinckiaceae bacterium]